MLSLGRVPDTHARPYDGLPRLRLPRTPPDPSRPPRLNTIPHPTRLARSRAGSSRATGRRLDRPGQLGPSMAGTVVPFDRYGHPNQIGPPRARLGVYRHSGARISRRRERGAGAAARARATRDMLIAADSDDDAGRWLRGRLRDVVNAHRLQRE